MREVVCLLCALTSVACMVLLIRGYRRTGAALLFWSAAGFLGFAISNLLLFTDLVILPEYNLSLYRQAATLAGVALLLYGLIRTNS
jgi:hypothetical protein